MQSLKQIFTWMEAEAEPENELSLMASYCFNHFTTLIVPLLATSIQREFAINAFTLYKA
ncbi:MAG: hypothetical protein GY950_32020 [bacterium]|nr:hypothetical protein [bacterium]